MGGERTPGYNPTSERRRRKPGWRTARPRRYFSIRRHTGADPSSLEAAMPGVIRLQTGYLRNYALGVAVGAVLLLAWFLTRAGL